MDNVIVLPGSKQINIQIKKNSKIAMLNTSIPIDVEYYR
jgi:hypothetical protein